MITKYINTQKGIVINQSEFDALYTDGKLVVTGTEIKEEIAEGIASNYDSTDVVDTSIEHGLDVEDGQQVNKVEYIYFRESTPQEVEEHVKNRELAKAMSSPKYAIKQEQLYAKKAELTSLSQDIVQHIAGVKIDNIENIKSSFVALHAEVRQLEGKATKGTVARRSDVNNSSTNNALGYITRNESYHSQLATEENSNSNDSNVYVDNNQNYLG